LISELTRSRSFETRALDRGLVRIRGDQGELARDLLEVGAVEELHLQILQTLLEA
jgi:hypothetical protein